MLKDAINPYFAETEQLRELFEVEQPELDVVQQEVEGWIKEMHFMTANDTLQLWEQDYSLPYNPALSQEQRRAQLYAKKMKRLIPLKEKVENVIKTLLGASRVTLEEKDCHFEIHVETATLMMNMAIAEDYFAKTRVAHFEYSFTNQVTRTYIAQKYFGGLAGVVRKTEMEVQR